MLNPTNGHIVAGVKIDDHRFLGRMRAAQLFQVAPDPRDTEDRKKLETSKSLQNIRAIREEMQRLFDGAKKKNVPSYANYIVDVHNESAGITPPITLFSEAPLPVEETDQGTAFAQIPWGQELTAIDGETQLAARHEAANIDQTTQQDFVPVYICHGRNVQWARQSFHDLNTLGVRPNTALSIGMDDRDPLTHVCRAVERSVEFFRGRVNTVRRQLKDTDADVVTITTLRAACVTLAKGINGVQFGSRPVPLGDDERKMIEACAIDWFRAVTEVLGPVMEDRSKYLAASPSVMAALGALGHGALAFDDSHKRLAWCRHTAHGLREVNWERGKLWEGIAGKFTPKGAFTSSGIKESAYAVYEALSNSSSPAYEKVREHRLELV